MTGLYIGLAALIGVIVGFMVGFMVGCFVGHCHAWALNDEEDEEEALWIG